MPEIKALEPSFIRPLRAHSVLGRASIRRSPAAALGPFLLASATPEIAAEAAKSALGLGLPVACAPGTTCWIANHVDVAPGGPDFACGARTHDGHEGGDFALRDLAAMEEGVAVLAAASGVVRAGAIEAPSFRVTRPPSFCGPKSSGSRRGTRFACA